MKMTPVFPHDIRPVHPGLYMVGVCKKDIDGDEPPYPKWAKFDGEVWGCSYVNKSEAETLPMDAFYADQSKCWRGVQG